MSKRFTDTEKWNDPWFRKLPTDAKVLFLYCCEQCNLAGFLQQDDEAISFMTGIEQSKLPKTVEEISKSVAIKDGWIWVKNFLRHQKNLPLNPHNPAHKHIIALLNLQASRFGISVLEEKIGALKGLLCPIGKGIGKGKKGGVGGNKPPFDVDTGFESIWLKYPNKTGRSKAEEQFRKSVKTLGDLQAIGEALRRYLKHLDANTWKSAQNGKTWFGNWREWVGYVDASAKAVAGEKPPGLVEAERIKRLEREAAPPPQEFLEIRDKLAMKKAI